MLLILMEVWLKSYIMHGLKGVGIHIREQAEM